MLTAALREFLLHGPHPAKKAKALLALGGAAHVRVAWTKHRAELMNSTPMGRRPWGFWHIEIGVLHQPAGEAGELRLIKQFELYRDDIEKEFVRKRLAEITADLRSHWHRRVA